MGRKRVYKIHGTTVVDVYLNIVADSEEDAIDIANDKYSDLMAEWCNNSVGVDEYAMDEPDELSHHSVNMIEYDGQYTEDLGDWIMCSDPGHDPSDCAGCPFASDCESFVEEEEDEEEI